MNKRLSRPPLVPKPMPSIEFIEKHIGDHNIQEGIVEAILAGKYGELEGLEFWRQKWRDMEQFEDDTDISTMMLDYGRWDLVERMIRRYGLRILIQEWQKQYRI